MMLSLLIYCYANGVFSSRRIERATWRDIGVRYVTAGVHPGHDTIAKFRRENFEAVAGSFYQVLLLAKELKLLQLGTVSVDGTKLDAAASKHRSVTYARAGELSEQLRLEIEALLQKAEQADGSSEVDPQALPREIARREELKRQLDAARERLEAQARQRAEAAREEPEPEKQSNLTDPDSRLMRRNQRAEYRQAYNAQAVVDAEGTQLVVGQRVSQSASDSGELGADLAAVPEELGQPQAVLADNGYANEAEVAPVEAQGVQVYVATGAEGRRKLHDFRPESGKEPPEPQADWLRAMAKKLDADEGRAKYKLRQQTVEPVFGIVKAVLGFRSFSLRGLEKVCGEWSLVTLAYNCKRLHKLQQQAAV